jgi:hypothetical protein
VSTFPTNFISSHLTFSILVSWTFRRRPVSWNPPCDRPPTSLQHSHIVTETSSHRYHRLAVYSIFNMFRPSPSPSFDEGPSLDSGIGMGSSPRQVARPVSRAQSDISNGSSVQTSFHIPSSPPPRHMPAGYTIAEQLQAQASHDDGLDTASQVRQAAKLFKAIFALKPHSSSVSLYSSPSPYLQAYTDLVPRRL